MTTLFRQRNWKIQVYGREHGIPHFHLRTSGGSAVVSIETLEVLVDGAVNSAVIQEARTWAEDHRIELLAEWVRLNPEKA